MEKLKNPYVWKTILFLIITSLCAAVLSIDLLKVYWGLIAFTAFMFWVSWLLKDVGVTEYEGKRYTFQSVGMDVDKAYGDSIDVTLGKLSLQEHKRRDRTGYYAIHAYVQEGKQAYTWTEEKINKDIFLRYAHDADALPLYLQIEAYDKFGEKLKNVRQYRERMSTRK